LFYICVVKTLSFTLQSSQSSACYYMLVLGLVSIQPFFLATPHLSYPEESLVTGY